MCVFGHVDVDASEGPLGDVVQANPRPGGWDVVRADVLLAQGGVETFIQRGGLRVPPRSAPFQAFGVRGFGQGEDGGAAIPHDKRPVAPDGPPKFPPYDEEAM